MRVDLIPSLTNEQIIHCSQNDTQLRKWAFELVSNDALIEPQGSFSLVYPTGEIPLTVDGNDLLCDCTADLSARSGMFPCKVKITNGDEVLYSSIITLHCEVRP